MERVVANFDNEWELSTDDLDDAIRVLRGNMRAA
jgi:hypothetical protein